jgi:hypothetical protein
MRPYLLAVEVPLVSGITGKYWSLKGSYPEFLNSLHVVLLSMTLRLTVTHSAIPAPVSFDAY